MGIFDKKKNEEVYGPKNEKVSDENKLKKMAENFQTVKQTADDAAVLGGGKYTVKNGASSYTRQGKTTPKTVTDKALVPAVTNQLSNNDLDYSAYLKRGMEAGLPADKLSWAYDAREKKINENPMLEQYRYDDVYKDWIKYIGADNDLGANILSAIASGANPSQIELLNQERIYKALQNPNLSKYAYDEIFKRAEEYINEKNKYASDYEEEVKKAVDDIKERKPFSYDVTKDPLYQSYLEQARQQGQMAMENTLADVASAAGGMNSWAVSAAQGINNNYMQRVNDVIPQLWELAYSKYLNDESDKRSDLSMLLDMENRDYGRWQYERSYNDSKSDALYNRNEAKKQWEYATEQDEYNRAWNEDEREYSRAQADKQWNYAMEQDEYARRQTAYQKALEFASMGLQPPEDIVKESGVDAEKWREIANRALMGFSSSGKGGGSGSKSGSGKSSSGSSKSTLKDWVSVINDQADYEGLDKALIKNSPNTYKVTDGNENFVIGCIVDNDDIDVDTKDYLLYNFGITDEQLEDYYYDSKGALVSTWHSGINKIKGVFK